ncbi:hypothetical protein BST13_12395 [Mycobacterium aquaticum]|uniref:Uncharacterized protein n=2 Tax=Mycobacterium aquaticum TaxID=1927124 RepID=A0A1X0B2B1_9MYCO|nr:hypothetical protein BST13_12395 [Mycobacterium aquaticum]
MALACVPLDKINLDGYIVNYVKNGHLLTREQILQDPEAGLEDYYQSQFDYLANRGFAVLELSDWYRKARNA